MHPIFRCAKLALVLFFVVIGASLASSTNPAASKKAFEDAKKNAEVVADVRVLSAVCTESEAGGQRLTLQLSLHVLDSAKGPAKKNDVLVVTYKVKLPSGMGLPGMYGYTAAATQFPFTPGVKGNVALNWDKEKRQYVAVAGWVPEPNTNPKALPREVGQVMVASEPAKKP
jgi:hypothetical protein